MMAVALLLALFRQIKAPLLMVLLLVRAVVRRRLSRCSY
jgi:hypothetical protein